MKIIKASRLHLSLLIPLFDGYRVFYKQPSDLEKARKFMFDRLENEDTVIFLALEGDKALGFTQLFPTFSSVSCERSYILNDLYVLPDHRGQKIGYQLLEHAKQYTKDLGYKGLALETDSDNPAQHLYERLGWEKDTTLHYFWKRT